MSADRRNGYRADIDGLRAVAVLSVLFFHAGFPGFDGGFVGVDVFFVISGFLIARILRAEIADGRFSFRRFYERRARRILPVLLVVIAATTPAAAYFLMPDDFESYGLSVLSILGFVSNIFFWQETRSYFGDIADLTVMLHTWSLAVEEQFYLLFPVLLIGLARWRRSWTPAVLLLLTVGSLALFVVGSSRSPSATFFLTPARAWELGLGALIAYGIAPTLPMAARRGAGLLGLGLILLAVTGFDEIWPARGAAVIAACFGAALVILSGDEKPSGAGAHRLLATSPMVFLGLISYSLYLWHWPIIVLMRHRLGVFELPVAYGVLALIATLALSALSWRYVEQPARNARRLPTRAMAWGLAGGVAAMAALGGVIVVGNGLPGRFSPALQILAANDRNPDQTRCFDVNPTPGACALGAEDAAPSFLFWGDSHSNALFPAIDEAARQAGVGGVFAGLASCAPVVDAPSGVRACDAFNEATVDYLRAHPEIRRVILASRWAFHMTDCSPLFDTTAVCEAQDAALTADDPRVERIRTGLQNLVGTLTAQGRKVYFIAGLPEFAFRPPPALVRHQRWDTPLPAVPDLAAVLKRNRMADSMMAWHAESPAVSVVSLRETLCTPVCQLAHNGRATYVDDNHVSTSTGRDLLAPVLRQQIWGGAPAQDLSMSASETDARAR